MNLSSLPVILLSIVVLNACVTDKEIENQDVGIVEQGLKSNNRIVLNRIVLNRIVLNRIVLNSLSDENLAHDSVSELKESEEGRELLLYVVRCALAEDDSLIISHNDETYELPGLMGLASDWQQRALTDSEQRWLSACLLGHVNAYGVSVELSLRARDLVGASAEEAAAFPVYEATFFGNIFLPPDNGVDNDEINNDSNSSSLTAYACLGSTPDIAMAHAPTRSLRVCADPTPDCELETLGYCRDVCETYIAGTGWTDCWAEGHYYAETTSSFLRAAEGTCRESCAGAEDCTLSCADAATEPSFSGGQIYDCDGADSSCFADCTMGTCSINASQTHLVTVSVSNGAQAETICADSAFCVVECSGANTTCDIDCSDTDMCQITQCTDGAECLLDCSRTDWCSIEECDGEVKLCDNGVTVCNRDCP